MAGTILITQTLDQIKTVAAAVTGLSSGRVFQGYRRFTDSENYQNLISALSAGQGYFEFWLDSAQRGSQGQDAIFTLGARLYTPVPKDTTNDLNTAVELADTLLDALLLPSNFTGLGMPQFGQYQFKGVSIVKSQGIAEFSFGGPDGGQLIFMGGC